MGRVAREVVEAVRECTGIPSSVSEPLKRSEGYRGKPYRDHLGNWTIGYGTLLEGKGLSREESEVLLLMRAGEKRERLVAALARRGIALGGLPAPVQATLLRMSYQMGVGKLMRFRRMLAAVHDGRWKTAYAEALDSTWARGQTPDRARRVAAGFLAAGG